MTLLVDTSVWIDHFRMPNLELMAALARDEVLTHPSVIGELAMGSIRQRSAVLVAMKGLQQSVIALDSEVLDLVERAGLHGKGLSWIDAHLLASALLTAGSRLWTHDRRLHDAANVLKPGLAA